VDNEINASMRNYSPVFLAGRLVLQGSMVYRYDDLSNSTSTLGAGSGLRGYPSAVFFGASRVAGHVEWRTLPLEFYTFHLGAAAFYDTGGIADRGDWSDLSVYHGTGLGLRLLNPAGNRIVMRADWGIPLTPVAGLATWPGEFTFGFEQAF
jgi:outer membrane translocation and assembly module TamA